ncbi:GDP-fucose protein O-fucosyltransferase 1-like isoform X2 [Ptychodera flava]
MILPDQTIIRRLLYLAVLVLISFPLVTSGDDQQNDADDEEKVIFINDDENVFGVDSKNQLNVGSAGKLPVWDPFGYVMYCPCMGRFGNQAEQFLGSIAFAKALNRTLVVPPWRTYKNVPYDEFFKYEELQKAHKVILMEEFMEYLAPSHWQPGQRLGYCWLPRNSDQKCQMKKGSPFGPFWDAFNIDFDELVSYHVSSYVSGSEKDFSAFHEEWNSQFPVSEHPVFAFKGAPASFPVHPENRKYHQYMKWSDSIMSEVNAHIQQLFHGESFVGIHLRNGMDWDRACNHAEGRHNLMASPQCLERGQLLTRGMCYPTTPSILETTKAVVMKIQAKHVS